MDQLLVATDDHRISDFCHQIGAPVALTRGDHPSGTDRIAEAASQLPGVTHVINIQGDEPLLDPELVDSLAHQLREDQQLEMVTAASPLVDQSLIADPNIVKLVINRQSDALYFSRSPIPFFRSPSQGLTTYRHLGIYGYQMAFLNHFVSQPPSPLEIAEGLEQLRALEHGARIRVHLTDHEAIGLDSPDQIALIESLLANTSS